MVTKPQNLRKFSPSQVFHHMVVVQCHICGNKIESTTRSY